MRRYEIACEHSHSCLILLAKTSYKKDGQWNTWIDYDKFHELARAHKNTGLCFVLFGIFWEVCSYTVFCRRVLYRRGVHGTDSVMGRLRGPRGRF